MRENNLQIDKRPPELVGTKELAHAVSASTRTVERWRADGKIPYLRVSPRLLLYSVPSVVEALGRFAVKAKYAPKGAKS